MKRLSFSSLLRKTARTARDRALDWANVFEIPFHSRSTELQTAPGGAERDKGPTHGIFLYHDANPATDRHYKRLVAETQGLITWHRLYNPDGAAEPRTDLVYQHPALLMPWRFADMLENGGVQGGFADVAILPPLIATEAAFVWVMEYDVDFAGHWSEFFEQFANNRADFLTTMLASRPESTDWVHWPATRSPDCVNPARHLRAFNPIMRLSRRFALGYVEALGDPGWRGHNEFTLPSIAANGGFSVEEIGGQGRFCPPQRRGTLYTAPANQELRGEGTFVWRPISERLYVDRPDLFPEKGFLYHPCKVGVSDWQQVERTKVDVQSADRQSLTIAVVMCTCNGAEYLHDQLASLERQTRPPDELIVGDDASTDTTVEILQAFAQKARFPVKLIVRPNRLGFAANFMKTAEAANSDLVFFCDQDDIWHERKVEIVENAARTTSALAYSHDFTVFSSGNSRDKLSIPSYFNHLRSLGLDPSLSCKGCCLAIRTELIQKLGWPPRSTISHDAWIAILATALAERLIIAAPLLHHRIHASNASGWIVSPEEARQRVKSSTAGALASMLDFYLHAWAPDWIGDLRECLRSKGMQINPMRARSALEILQAWPAGEAELPRREPNDHDATV